MQSSCIKTLLNQPSVGPLYRIELENFFLIKVPLLLFVAMIVSADPLWAEETDQPQNSWQISTELGYIATGGNTDTDSLNVKASALTDREIWRHYFALNALNSSSGNVRTAQKYSLLAQSDYKLDSLNYLFARLNYDDDRFAGFDYQATEVVGYGRRVVDRDTLKLNLEIGPGARQTRLNDGSSENEALLFTAAKLDWLISNTSTFSEVLTMEAGEDTTITKSVSSLSAQIDSNLSMKLTYTYKDTSDVPPGTDGTDTETSVTLVYTF